MEEGSKRIRFLEERTYQKKSDQKYSTFSVLCQISELTIFCSFKNLALKLFYFISKSVFIIESNTTNSSCIRKHGKFTYKF